MARNFIEGDTSIVEGSNKMQVMLLASNFLSYDVIRLDGAHELGRGQLLSMYHVQFHNHLFAGMYHDPSKNSLKLVGDETVHNASRPMRDMGGIVIEVVKHIFELFPKGGVIDVSQFVFIAPDPFAEVVARDLPAVSLAFSGNTFLLTAAGYLDWSEPGLVLQRDGMLSSLCLNLSHRLTSSLPLTHCSHCISSSPALVTLRTF